MISSYIEQLKIFHFNGMNQALFKLSPGYHNCWSIDLIKLTWGRMFILIIVTLACRELGRDDHPTK